MNKNRSLVAACLLGLILPLADFDPVQAETSNPDGGSSNEQSQIADSSQALHTIRAVDMDGFARLLISAERGESVDVKFRNGILLLSFDKSKDADFEAIRKAVPDYVALTRKSQDGRTFRFALKQDYRTQQSRGLEFIAIDLVPEDYPGMPEKLRIVMDEELDADEQVKKLEEEMPPQVYEFVGVRVSENDVFTRISFDWPRSVDYSAALEDGVVRINFSAIGDPDLSRLRVDPPRYIRTADKYQRSEGTEVDIKVARRANMRHHREGPTVVVDLFEADGVSHFTDADAVSKAMSALSNLNSVDGEQDNPDVNNTIGTSHSEGQAAHKNAEVQGARGQAKGLEMDPGKNSNTQNSQTGEAIGDTLPALKSNDDGDDHNKGQGGLAAHAIESGSRTPGNEEDVAHAVADVLEEVETASAHGEIAAGEHGDILVGEVETSDHSAVESHDRGADEVLADTPDVKENAHRRTEHGKLHDRAVVNASEDVHQTRSQPDEVEGGEPLSSEDAFEVQGYDDGKAYSVIFEWDRPVPAAVFKRDNVLWIAFDDMGQEFDLSNLNSAYGKYIIQANQLKLGSARIVQLSLERDLLIEVKNDAGTWMLDLRDEAEHLPRLIGFEGDYLEDGRAIVRADLKEYSTIHQLTDPFSGEALIVVTAYGPPRGVLSTRRFVEFNVMESSHGLVVRPLADRIYVKGDGQDIVIGSEGQKGLIVSRVGEEGSDAYAFDITQEPGRIDLIRWKGGADEDYPEIEQKLQTAAVVAPDTEAVAGLGRGQAAQARFYLAHELAHEALGILREMRRQNEDVEVDPSYLALRGVAYYMAGRYPMALKDLSFSRLEDDPDAKLWRAATLRKMGRYGEARQLFQETKDVWANYPVHWQNQFHLAAADAALNTKDLKTVEEHLTLIQDQDITSLQRAEVRLVNARLQKALNNSGAAIKSYESVIASRKDPFATYAEFDLVQLKRELDQMSIEDAITTLSRLQYTWRGDELEFSILHKLGQLYIERGDYRIGLTTLRDVISSLESGDMMDSITRTMADTFSDLYLQGKADDMPPIKALGLYYEFRELTPIGRDGDDMIRKLVDRLIAVDLLGQAAELLSHQVRNRLSGVARSQVAARLSLVYLMDQRPDEAIQILRATRQIGLPKDLAKDRRLIEARAMAELKRYGHALELIDGYFDLEFERLRSDIYWESQDWLKSGQKIEELIERTYEVGKAMSDRMRSDVLRCAVAYSLAENLDGLAALDKAYGEIMRTSSDAEAFDLLISSSNGQDVDFRRLAAQIAGTNTLDVFMEEMSVRFDVGRAGS